MALQPQLRLGRILHKLESVRLELVRFDDPHHVATARTLLAEATEELSKLAEDV